MSLLSFSLSIYLCTTIMIFFFFNDTATTEIYTLSLHDALPILRKALGWPEVLHGGPADEAVRIGERLVDDDAELDRKSTRLNSSHSQISYAVFCLKKKKKKEIVLVAGVQQ